MARKQLAPEDLITVIVDITDIEPAPENARRGDIELIGNSIEMHGQFRPILVSEDGVVLAGNHTYAAALAAGKEKIVVTRLKGIMYDSPQAKEIMLMDNRANDVATYDDELLTRMLKEVDKQVGSLAGTGFEDDFLKKLIEEMNQDSSKKLSDKFEYKIIVECAGEEHQAELIAEFEEKGLKVRALIS